MDQPHGNFIAFMNRDKQPGDNKPTFDGRLAVPGTDIEKHFALWAHEYADPKTGEVRIMFNGQTDAISTSAAPMDQVASLLREGAPERGPAELGGLKLAPRQIVLFPNAYKADAPEKSRPDYWGAYYPGNNAPVVRISVWAKKDRQQHAMLAGATSYPVPGKSEAQQQDAAPELKSLIDRGVVSKGMPKEQGAGRA